MYKLTIPNDPTSLRAAAEFFAGLCGCQITKRMASIDMEINVDTTKLKKALQDTEKEISALRQKAEPLDDPVVPPPDPTPLSKAINQIFEPDPASIFAAGPAAPHINYTGMVPSTIAGQLVPIPPPAVTPPNPVITDKNGLPWDARIHAATKSTIADGSWRVRKQPATMNKEEWEAYVSQIMAELESAMAVPVPPPAAESKSTIKTLAELTAAILAAGILPVEVQLACNKVDVSGYPMLNSRPDLIPAVAKELGLV